MKLAIIIIITAASLAVASRRNGDPTSYEKIGPLEISTGGINHIVSHETGGKAYYSRFYERPQDPGFSSGVTVGFGYDLKFHSPARIRKDWAGVASASEIAAMCSVSGLDGAVYRRIKWKVHIDWQEGLAVFKRTTLPEWSRKTYRAYRIAQLGEDFTLHPHAAASLVGNSFNRGLKIANRGRFREKYERRQHILNRRWDRVPQTYRDEQRLWPGHAGLTRRRREEAELFELALKYQWWQ